MPKLVLVVDDESVVRDELRELLESEGYAVATASDGLEAIAAIERARPMVAVIDLLMPQMDGWKLLESLTASRPPIPAIVLTAGRSENPFPAHVPVFIKPVAIEELLRAVRTFDAPLYR